MSTAKELRVRDNRQPGYFWLDNEILDVYGPRIGTYALAVYNVLARHVYNTGKCSLSMRKIATLIGVSVSTVSRSVAKLTEEQLVVVEIDNQQDKNSPQTYILVEIKGCSPQEQQGEGCSPQEQGCPPREQGVPNRNANKEKELTKNSKNKTNPDAPPNGSAGEETEDPFTKKSTEEEKQSLKEVWIYYIRQLHRDPKRYTATSKRKLKGLCRLRECRKKCGDDLGAAVSLMKQAIDALAVSEYHVTHGHIDWEQNLFRSAEKLEWWLDRVVTAKDSNGQANGTRIISRGHQQTLDNLSAAQRFIQSEIETSQASGDSGGVDEGSGGDVQRGS